ncbi:hypothetical protein TWF281_006587 [Arthrobotrys megalospora]
MTLQIFPNEILLEIFSHLNVDTKTTFEWPDYTQLDPSLQVKYVEGCNYKHQDGNRAPIHTPEENTNQPDRATLFNLRLVCRRFEEIVTPLAFSMIRLCYGFEHTQRAVSELTRGNDNPLLRYVQHISISPMALLPKVCKRSDGQLQELVTEETTLDYPYTHQSQWARAFIKEIQALFTNLPGSVEVLTFYELPIPTSHRSLRSRVTSSGNLIDIGKLNELFNIAISYASNKFETSQIKSFNVYSRDLQHAENLWKYFGDNHYLLDDIFEDKYSMSYDPRVPTYIHGAEEVNVYSANLTHQHLDRWSTKGLTRHMPDSIKKLSIRSLFAFSQFLDKLKIPCSATLASLVIEGVGAVDQRILGIIDQLVSADKIHIYSTDIADEVMKESPSRQLIVDPTIEGLHWSNVFDRLARLEKLVDFRAGNISYQTVRRGYKYLDVNKLWLFSEYEEDFRSFCELRSVLVQRRGTKHLPRYQWLDEAGSEGGCSGWTLQRVEEGLENNELVLKKTEEDILVENRRLEEMERHRFFG